MFRDALGPDDFCSAPEQDFKYEFEIRTSVLRAVARSSIEVLPVL